MGLFGVKRYDHEYDNGGKSRHYFSVLSPEDLSESKRLELPFDDDEAVDGGSCGDVVYFYGNKGRTVIFNLQTNETIQVPAPKVLSVLEHTRFRYDPKSGEYIPPLDCDDYGVSNDANYGENVVMFPINGGRYKGCGVSYDAKSGDYKVIRIYTQFVASESGRDEEYYFDLYSVLSDASKYITGPALGFWYCTHFGTSIYVGEAGSGSGTCYWAPYPCADDDRLHKRVLLFDFATESFDYFPLPANPNPHNYRLVGCRGSVGVLVYWRPPDEFSVEPYQFSSDLYIQLFVNGKGTSWDLLYDVTVPDGERPVGLKDDRCLFLVARPSGDRRMQLMVYYLASKTSKKLDIYNCSRDISGICFGDKRRKKKGKGKGK